MPDAKRHHFVPQFYLRRFASSPQIEGETPDHLPRSICCYNKKRRMLIERASIRGQCAIDNFYGWHECAERTLGMIEGEIATLLRRITEQNRLPDFDSDSWNDLLVFIALQLARTKLSGDGSDAIGDYTAKLMAQGHPEFDGVDLSNVEVRSQYPAAIPIKVALESYPLIRSLDGALIINNTPMPFWCSDNPVIRYNSSMSHILDHGVIGLDCKGLQIIFPIDPSRAIYLFDPGVYRRPSNTGIRKIGIADAAQINMISYMQAGENIYFRDLTSGPFAVEVSAITEKYLPYKRVVFRESQAIDHDDDTSSSIIHQFRTQPPIEALFTFSRHEKGSLSWVNQARSHITTNDPAAHTKIDAFRFPDRACFRPQLTGRNLTVGIRRLQRLVNDTGTRS